MFLGIEEHRDEYDESDEGPTTSESSGEDDDETNRRVTRLVSSQSICIGVHEICHVDYMYD